MRKTFCPGNSFVCQKLYVPFCGGRRFTAQTRLDLSSLIHPRRRGLVFGLLSLIPQLGIFPDWRLRRMRAFLFCEYAAIYLFVFRLLSHLPTGYWRRRGLLCFSSRSVHGDCHIVRLPASLLWEA